VRFNGHGNLQYRQMMKKLRSHRQIIDIERYYISNSSLEDASSRRYGPVDTPRYTATTQRHTMFSLSLQDSIVVLVVEATSVSTSLESVAPEIASLFRDQAAAFALFPQSVTDNKNKTTSLSQHPCIFLQQRCFLSFYSVCAPPVWMLLPAQSQVICLFLLC
jgi:hypothetical protein